MDMAEAASHIAQPEALTTRTAVYQGALGRRGKKKKEDWQQMLAQVPNFKFDYT